MAGNLVKLRKKKGWTQADLAEKADFSVKGIQKIEYQATNPSTEALDKLAKALGVSVSELFEGSKPRSKPTDLHSAGALLTKLADLSPMRRALALALIFDDISYLDGNPSLSRAFSNFSRTK